MKTAVIVLKNKKNKLIMEYVKALTDTFDFSGLDVHSIHLIDAGDDIGYRRAFSDLASRVETLLVVGADFCISETTSLVLERFDTTLVENDNARKFVEQFANSISQTPNEELYKIPLGATVIPNVNGVYQGYLIEDELLMLCVLPAPKNEKLSGSEKYFLSYLENKSQSNKFRATLKYFGDGEALYNAIDKVKKIGDFKYNLTHKFGDWKIELEFENESLKREVLRQIIFDIGEDVYSETDGTLAERLFDILTLRGLKLATAESFTAGKIASSLIQIPGASRFFHEGIVAYSNTSKMERLDVREFDLKSKGAVSSIVAYQMCAGLLLKGDVDVAISTTGIAGPKSDDTNKPVGLCYVGVGMKDGIHTYKYNFTGSREEITETAINTAMFLAIKKLKRI